MRKHLIFAAVLILLAVIAVLVGPCVLKTPTEIPPTSTPEPGAADSTG